MASAAGFVRDAGGRGRDDRDCGGRRANSHGRGAWMNERGKRRLRPNGLMANIATVLLILVMFGVTPFLTGGPTGGPFGVMTAQATHVVPVFLPGATNAGKSCSELQGPGQTWIEFKLEGSNLSNGPHSNGALSVTISNLTEDSFDWSS